MARIQNILVPIDFSPHSSAALDYAVGLAVELGGKIHLLHCYQLDVGGVSPYGIVMPENLDRDIREAARAKLAEWADKVSGQDVKVEQSVSPMFPSEAIRSTAEELGSDLIVMGTRGLSGLKHVLLGSVAERTVRMAPCPVLTVKHPDEE